MLIDSSIHHILREILHAILECFAVAVDYEFIVQGPQKEGTVVVRLFGKRTSIYSALFHHSVAHSYLEVLINYSLSFNVLRYCITCVCRRTIWRSKTKQI